MTRDTRDSTADDWLQISDFESLRTIGVHGCSNVGSHEACYQCARFDAMMAIDILRPTKSGCERLATTLA